MDSTPGDYQGVFHPKTRRTHLRDLLYRARSQEIRHPNILRYDAVSSVATSHFFFRFTAYALRVLI